ncbi:MAG TPA: hypothetical protein V6C58_23205 [Allocoleopsis sp.]
MKNKDLDNLVKMFIQYKNTHGNKNDIINMLGSGLLDRFIAQDKLRKPAQQMLDKYGNDKIVKIQVYRTPIFSALKTFLNIISLGKFSSATKNYDDLFHLAMIITVQLDNGTLKNLVVEKISVVNISTSYKTNDKTQVQEVDLKGKDLTLKGMIDETLKSIPTKRFYLYDAFNSDPNSGNCQRFISDILKANGLMTPELNDFINQDAEDIAKNLSSYVPKVARAITDIGAVFGAGNDDYALHAVVVKKPTTPDELIRIQNEFIKNKNRTFIRETKTSYRLRNIPKTKFIKNSFKSKKINKKITLIYGKIKI